MILVVLALIWVVALTPTLLRKLSEREFTYSVAKFHRSLRVMRQVQPGLAAAGGMPRSNAFAVPAVGMPGTGARVARGGNMTSARPAARSTAPASTPRSAAPSARRRRQILAVLAGGLFATFVLGFVPSLAVLWDASLFLLAVTAAYVALLVHFRRMATERSEKVLPIEQAPPVPYRERVSAVRVRGEHRELRPASAGVGG